MEDARRIVVVGNGGIATELVLALPPTSLLSSLSLSNVQYIVGTQMKVHVCVLLSGMR